MLWAPEPAHARRDPRPCAPQSVQVTIRLRRPHVTIIDSSNHTVSGEWEKPRLSPDRVHRRRGTLMQTNCPSRGNGRMPNQF